MSESEKEDISFDDQHILPERGNEQLRSEFDSLEAEMDIAGYGTNNYNRARRKISRSESKRRTIKRKSLEKIDKEVSAVTSNVISRQKRIRGSKAALDDSVTMSSLIFDSKFLEREKNDIEFAEHDESSDNDDEVSKDDNDEYEEEVFSRYEMLADDLDIRIIDDEGNEDNQDKILNTSEPSIKKSRRLNPITNNYFGKSVAKTMYRLRNFSSQRMAEKHGDALGAHARGHNKTAVNKLQQVASAAPVAPQVYSSLGLVYENMLRDKSITNTPIETNDIHKVLNEQLSLAKKTFASYHLAAVLCKMDYSLWIRSGDAATVVAFLHDSYLRLPRETQNQSNVVHTIAPNESQVDRSKLYESDQNLLSVMESPQEYVTYHKNEFFRWLEEAKEDYQTADNHRPPGIGVPSKLAKTQMHLGNLIEALTILTDMKNLSQAEIANNLRSGNRSRTELELSHEAWILYADLMLAIGHECDKWNDGNQTAENYMLRRWLRKFSQSFDWKERRLQALCFALEAAAGSKSCLNFRKWTNQRMTSEMWKAQENYESDLKTERSESNINNDYTIRDSSDVNIDHVEIYNVQQQLKLKSRNGDDQSVSISDFDDIESQFQSERNELLLKIKNELRSFDDETSRMTEESRSYDALERAQKRVELIRSHKQSIMALAVKFKEKKLNLVKDQTKDDLNESHRDDLVMSCGCATVFNIASQLLQLLLSMGLYTGGLLVAEAVSAYLKERSKCFDNRRSQEIEFEQRYSRGKGSLIQLNTEFYDNVQINSADKDDEEDSIIYLSDDEDLYSDNGEAFIKLMRRGILPPELQVLHGICLLCSKDMDFLAKKMIESIESLPFSVPKDISSLDGTSDSASSTFSRMSTLEPTDKLKALELISDTLKKAGKLDYWSSFLTKYYSNLVCNIQDEGSFISLLESDHNTVSQVNTLQRCRLLKVFLVALEIKIICAKELLSSRGDDSRNFNVTGMDIVFEVLQLLNRFKSSFWHLDAEGNPISESKMFLKLMASLCSTFLEYSEKLEAESLSNFILMLNPLISLVFDVVVPSMDSNEFPVPDLMRELWTDYPLPSSWQSANFIKLSRVVRNLCIGSNVMAFSGWEKEDFSTRLLKRRNTRSYFGVRVKGSHVAGWLNKDQEVILEKQWVLARSFLPNYRGEDFSNALVLAKQSEWLQNSITMKNEFDSEAISNLGEQYAIQILLAYSDCCLRRAALDYDKEVIDNLLQRSYSIILPMTQFCLDKTVWEIDTCGLKQSDSITSSEIVLFPMVHEMEPSKNSNSNHMQCGHQKAAGNSKSHHASRYSKGGEDFIQSLTDPMIKLVKVPIDLMLKEWLSQDHTASETSKQLSERSHSFNDVSEHLKSAMKSLHLNVSKVKKCSSITSLQKASLKVTSSLLEISEMKGCANPFLCLNHAAIFASYGPKGGNYDEPFKRQLPKDEECTPEEALNILGRADCLRCLHFTKESMFLCTYVARVCCRHRDKKITDMVWSPKWRVVGVYLYTVSVCIESVLTSLTTKKEDKIQALASWDDDVRAEIGRSRSDAIALCKSNGVFDTSSPSRTEDISHDSVGFNDSEVLGVDIEIARRLEETSFGENGQNAYIINMPNLFHNLIVENTNTIEHEEIDSVRMEIIEV